ncbi:hypothetical protein EDB92DRAFT_1819604 [Lactarius akahatsu]|uniref:Uncharacterized protein n=1 Tax=Lactarius akahatsu TaxID=416441 RepID=A0AAD4L8Z6_9AGAM|nr:hypothetical protein EDB92DRAFT_1819604 [Lactarius akahatsu]
MLLDNVPATPADDHQINQIYLPSECSSPTAFLPPLWLPTPSPPPPVVPPPDQSMISLALLVAPTDERPPPPSPTPDPPTDSPPPRPPRSPLHPYSPHIQVAEDDNTPTEGVKTSTSSVLDCETPQENANEDEDDWTLFAPRPVTAQKVDGPTLKTVEYPPIFPSRAFEMLRDLDEVMPQAPRRRT